MNVLADLVAQQLHGKTRLVAVENGAMDQQSGRFVDRDQLLVAVDDRQLVARQRRSSSSSTCPST